jgi:hypothetical protein
MPRPRRRQPDPARFPPGSRPVYAGQCYPGGADSWPEGRVCKYCYLQARLRTGTCADCGALTSLPGLNATGQPACPRCSGIPARFRCGCGREITGGGRRARAMLVVRPGRAGHRCPSQEPRTSRTTGERQNARAWNHLANSSRRNQAGNELPELAGGSRLSNLDSKTAGHHYGTQVTSLLHRVQRKRSE